MNWIKLTENISTLSFDNLTFYYGTNSLADNSSILRFLTSSELVLSEKLKDCENKKTWIACRATLRILLGDFNKVDPLDICFRKSKFGKPYLIGSSLNFNTSHTKTSFLLGFNRSGRIGVDIEKLNDVVDMQELINLMFTKTEAEQCASSEGDKEFLKIWTLKEAFLKASGIGLINNLKYISVIANDNNNVISKYNLKSKTFIGPNGETCSAVFAKY